MVSYGTGFHPSWSSLCCLGFFSGTSLRTRRLVPSFYGKLRPAGLQTVRARLVTTFYATITYSTQQHTQRKNSLLQYRSICYAGIVQTDGRKG